MHRSRKQLALLLILTVAAAAAACKKPGPTPPGSVVPDYAGMWNGAYTVTGCTNSGFFSDVAFCSQVLNSSAQASFTLAQTDRQVTGTFQLGSLNFTGVNATIAEDGSLAFTRTINDSGFSIEASWTLRQQTAGTVTGQTHQVWRATGQNGEAVLDGSMASATR